MKHLKTFEGMKDLMTPKSNDEFLSELENLKFVSPELDYSELFRIFNVFSKSLPKDIDKKLFDKNKYYVEMIPKKMNDILANTKFNIKNGLGIKKKIDKKWHPFIDFIYEKFKNGKNKTVDPNFLSNVYFGETYKKNKQSFHNFIKDPDYKENKKGDLNDYFKSFDWFDKNPNKIPTTVIIKINDNYYLVGGNRRLSWILSRGVKKIPIWLI